MENIDKTAASATPFFSKIYDETFELLVQARDYLAGKESALTVHYEPAERLYLTTLTMRLTAQLTDVMAWLLVQKAVQNNEMTKEEAAKEKHRLLRWSGNKVVFSGEVIVPLELELLIYESQKIYERVSRLERQLSDVDVGAKAEGSSKR